MRTKIVDRDLLTCKEGKYAGRKLTTVMSIKQVCIFTLNSIKFNKFKCYKIMLYNQLNKVLYDECQHPEIKNCSCTFSYLSPNGIPINTLNCSHRNFINFPKYLPENTSILHMEHNKITNIKDLRSNYTLYKSVVDIFLDYNYIGLIDDFESYIWLQNFRVLSLRGNKLTKIPIYALRNALDKNKNIGKIYLSNNPWRCDCSFVPKFQELLLKHYTLIKDVTKIECKYIEGDDLFKRDILSLKRSEVCKTSTNNSIHALDWINGVLASLIILILSKLGYDYYRYRRYGKVPWIVSKMP